MPDTFDQWLDTATADRRSTTVCFNRALLHELEQTEAALAEAQESATSMLEEDQATAAAKAKVDALKQQVEEASRALVFESIGRKPWQDLLADHPPTEEQRKRHLDHDPESFPAAALAATCVEPGMTVESAQKFIDTFPPGVVDRVWATCLTANVTGSRDPFDTEPLRAGARK